MPAPRGMTLIEVLVALLLMITISLLLLKQQWSINRLVNEIDEQSQVLLAEDNNAEMASS